MSDELNRLNELGEGMLRDQAREMALDGVELTSRSVALVCAAMRMGASFEIIVKSLRITWDTYEPMVAKKVEARVAMEKEKR